MEAGGIMAVRRTGQLFGLARTEGSEPWVDGIRFGFYETGQARQLPSRVTLRRPLHAAPHGPLRLLTLSTRGSTRVQPASCISCSSCTCCTEASCCRSAKVAGCTTNAASAANPANPEQTASQPRQKIAKPTVPSLAQIRMSQLCFCFTNNKRNTDHRKTTN